MNRGRYMMFAMRLGLLLTAAATASFAQQGPQFTQYMFNPVIFNPAYTGADEALRLTLIHRAQWTSVDGAPTTQGLYAHTALPNRLGLGFSFASDKIGVHRNQDIRGMVAYQLSLAKKVLLSFGMQGGLSFARSDYSSLNTGVGNVDPRVAAASGSATSLGLGIGIWLRADRLQLGVSVPSMIPSTATITDSLTIRWNRVNYLIYGKYEVPLSPNISFEPSLLLKYYPGAPLSYDVNACLVIRKALTLGLSYRKKESVDFLLRAQLTRQLQFGYSYDHVIGDVAEVSRGTHELSISYLFKFLYDNVESPR